MSAWFPSPAWVPSSTLGTAAAGPPTRAPLGTREPGRKRPR